MKVRKKDPAKLLAGLQALFQWYGRNPVEATLPRGRRAQKGPRRKHRDMAHAMRRHSSTSSSTGASNQRGRSTSSRASSGAPTPPSPPCSSSVTSNEATSDDERDSHDSRHRNGCRADKSGREVYDRRLAIQATNQRDQHILAYMTYFR